MCYTSGTTGMPKGVVYSHRSTVLHTLGVAAGNPLSLGISEQDVILPVVPMFHANAWGYPYIAAMLGSKLVYPGPHLDPESLLDDFVQEGVTWTAGVPTIWLGHPRHARRESRQVGSLADERDARRRLGGAALDDRRLQAAARHERRARLGDDRDVAGRVDRGASRATSPRPTRRRSSTTSQCRACRSRSSSCACATSTARSRRGTARRWASSRSAAPGSPRRTTTRRSRPTAGPTTAGSRRATSSRCTRAASS